MSVGGRIKYDLCNEISPMTANILGKSWVDSLAKPAEAICVAIRASQNPQDWAEENKACGDNRAVKLKIAPIKVSTKHLGGLPYSEIWGNEPPGPAEEYPNSEVYYTLELWLGFEMYEDTGRVQCIWLGIDGPDGDGGKETIACGGLPCDLRRIPVGDVHTLVDDVLSDLGNWADNGSAIDLILTVLKAVLYMILVAAIVYIAINATAIAIAGGAVGTAIAGLG
ncbi:hypothetical protein [Halocatena halophila]|uniref:hypothetical protein n=1 Tax=Halocatena halophila TaxID=2814576 RepID=UPI002ECFC59C